MDQRSDYIRQDIESTRAALDEKLDTLETKARQAFDLKHQVSERPWMMVGAAVAAGYVLGSLGGSESSGEQRWYGQPATTTDYNQHAMSNYDHNRQASTMSHSTSSDNYSSSGRSKVDSFLSQFDDEIDMLKTAAVATLTNFLRDAVREYVPSLGHQLDQTRSSSQPYAGRDRNLTPSTAPNASMSASAGPAGFDSPPQTTYSSSNMAAEASEHARPYYPPGSSGNADRDYVKTYNPPSETDRERAIGDEAKRY
jgi:hypothetical protein